MRPKLKTNQLTLIEVLISMTIFSIIMIVLATMLNGTMKLTRKRKQQANSYHQQQILGSIFSKDLKSMVANSEPGNEILLRLESNQAAFVTTSSIGVITPGTCPLNKVYYLVDGTNLCRGVKPCVTPYTSTVDWLDKTNSTIDSDVIAENVKNFSIVAEWPGTPTHPDTDTDTLPALITLTVELIDEHDSDKEVGGKDATRTFIKRIFIDRAND